MAKMIVFLISQEIKTVSDRGKQMLAQEQAIEKICASLKQDPGVISELVGREMEWIAAHLPEKASSEILLQRMVEFHADKVNGQ